MTFERSDDLYVVSPHVRLSTREPGTEWSIVHLERGSAWRTGPEYVAMLSNFGSPSNLGELDEQNLKLAVDAVEREILILDADFDPASEWYVWSGAHGWRMSADLLALNNGYPIHDYRTSQVRAVNVNARQRTGQYLASADTARNRAKVRLISGDVRLAFAPEKQPHSMISERALDSMLSAALAVLDYHDVDGGLIPRGARPSYGGLWSVRGYLYVDDVDDLDSGWHSFDPESGALQRLSSTKDPSLIDVVPALSRAPFVSRGLVVLTIDWTRLRLRYRDPYAIQSALIEAGHASGTMVLAANALGIQTYAQCGSDEPELARRIGLSDDPCVESVICAIAIG